MQRTDIQGTEQNLIAKGSTNPGDIVMFYGVLGIILGWVLIVGAISPEAGVACAGVGLLAVAIGFLGKRVAMIWHRLFD
jgi:hypothetical protein